MPMAGRGSRFANAGFTAPKPLIPVDGKPMFLKALSSLRDVKANKRFSIIIRKEHDTQYNLSDLLQKELPGAQIILATGEPIGATADALRAKPFLDADDAVVIMDCDLWFQSTGYNKMLEDSLRGTSSIDGGLLTFTSNDPRYSYAKIDDRGIVTETAEKRVISSHAITGAYFIATAKEFIAAGETLLRQPRDEKMPEYYVSLLYNILINEGKRVQAASVDEFASFGTPEELSAYQERNRSTHGHSMVN